MDRGEELGVPIEMDGEHAYALRFLDEQGVTKFLTVLIATDDDDAVQQAKFFKDGRTIEVWRNDTFVTSIPSDSAS